MRVSASLLLVVGLVWGLFVLWVFFSIAGVADAPTSILPVLVLWGSVLIGPLILTIGSALLLLGSSVRLGAFLVAIGCVILTGLATYTGITEIRQGLHPMEIPPPRWLYVGWLTIALLSDAAAYKVVRQVLLGSASISRRV